MTDRFIAFRLIVEGQLVLLDPDTDPLRLLRKIFRDLAVPSPATKGKGSTPPPSSPAP